MQLRPLLSFLALAGLASSVGAATVPDLSLPYLFSFEIQVAAGLDAVVYPYGGGQRLNVALTSGTLTTPGNGTIATLVPGLGGEQGVAREDGVLLVDARVVLQSEQSFDPDRKFSFLQIRGKSVFAADGSAKGRLFIEFETDSAPLAYLNKYYLAGTLIREETTLSINVYGADPSTF